MAWGKEAHGGKALDVQHELASIETLYGGVRAFLGVCLFVKPFVFRTHRVHPLQPAGRLRNAKDLASPWKFLL